MECDKKGTGGGRGGRGGREKERERDRLEYLYVCMYYDVYN